MPSIRRRLPFVRTLGVFILSSVVVSTTIVASPETVKARFGRDLTGLVSSVASPGSPFGPFMAALAGTNSLSEGSDGRLTVLFLGSDARVGGVSRTDTVMIMSLKGNVISAASIPRDTARIANPFKGGNFSGRVNAILKQLVKSTGSVPAGLGKFEIVIENLLQIEIDYYALIKFRGFDALVDVVDPIYINNDQTIKDSRFWDDPRFIKGVYFPAGANYQLNAWPNGPFCTGQWRTAANPAAYACHRALPFVRSRKGSGNSDFRRARRQQSFVAAVINAVTGSDLSPLVNTANAQVGAKTLYTDIPITLSNALALYSDLNSASLVHQVVFAPQTYSTHIPGTTAYQLKLSAVRAWTALYMK